MLRKFLFGVAATLAVLLPIDQQWAAVIRGVVVVPVPVVGTSLVGIRNLENWDTGSTPTGFYQTIEQCFKRTVVPTGFIAEPRKGDGTTVMTNWQADNRILWDDNSLRCARYTFKYPSQLAAHGAGGSTDTIKFYSTSGSWNNTPWTTATSYILANSDFKMETVISGTTYTCSMNNEIGRGSHTYQFDAGPTAVGLVAWGVFRNGAGSGAADQGALQCRIYVVAFENGDFKVWARADSCRPSNSTCAAASVTSAALKNVSTSVWSYGAFTFYGGTFFIAADTDGQPYYSGTDVRKVIAKLPRMALVSPETTNLWDAKVLPFMKITDGAISAMDTTTLYASPAIPISYAPITLADYGNLVGLNYDSPGNHQYVGQMTATSGIAMFKGDWISLRQDAIDALAEGAQNWHYRDHANGNLLNLFGGSGHNYTGMTKDATVACCSSVWWTITITGSTPWLDAGGNQVFNTSHIPSFAQYQLIYSGEEWWLDQYQDQVVGEIISRNPGTICYARNPIQNSQWWAQGGNPNNQETRGQAWFLRDAQNAAWLTPPAHPLYQYMQDLVSEYWGMANDFLSGPSGGCPESADTWTIDWEALGLFPTNFSWWEHDYWGYQASLALLRGQVDSSNRAIIYPLTKLTIGRAYNGCPSAAPVYEFKQIPDNGVGYFGPPWITAWSQVWVGSGLNLDGTMIIDGQYGTGAPFMDIAGAGCPTTPSGILAPDHTATVSEPIIGKPNGMGRFNANEDGAATFANFFYVGAILAKAAGITGAAEMVTYYKDGKALYGCCSDQSFAKWPQYAIEEPQ